jgi:hypothetical protein
VVQSLWGKTVFFIGTCALIVAGANSEINPAVVEATMHSERVRCSGPGVVVYPNDRLLILDGQVIRFPIYDVMGQYPSRVVMRLDEVDRVFVFHPQRQAIGQDQTVSYRMDQISDPGFKPRQLKCQKSEKLAQRPGSGLL